MSAANANTANVSHHEEVRASEPSMEEILASIRRIIADDEAAPLRREERLRAREVEPVVEAPTAQPAPSAYPAPALERREHRSSAPAVAETPRPEPSRADARPPLRLAVREAPPPAVEPPEAQEREVIAPDLAFSESYTLAVESYPAAAPEPHSQEPQPPLMSSEAASNIASHFETLAATMMINESGVLREYAQEMMRPMLKQWLDDNLPVIVERLVRAEIERVARGGRR